MNAKDCLTQRRSCRKFLDKKIARDTIQEIVELCRFAPSWKNTQIARYTIVDDEALKNEIAEKGVLGLAFNTKTITRAAAVAVISYQTGLSGRETDGSFTTPEKDAWEMFDAGIATQTFCLAAREYDIGTCIIGVMDTAYLHEKLALPADEKVACLVAMGYPEEWKSAPRRKEVEEILSFR